MSLDELLAEVGDGVLITEVMGLHSGVNPVSGDFSTGAEGRRITGGALAEPLREFTIASTLQRMLHDVVAIGSDLRWPTAPPPASASPSPTSRSPEGEPLNWQPSATGSARDGFRLVGCQLTGMAELLELAERVAAMAAPGEQVEAYVARGRQTSVKSYQGEVESLTQAESSGIGVRVIVDHRQGFAYAGTLDEAVVLDTLAEARDNAKYGEPDEFNGLAEPDGVAPPDVDLWRDDLAALPADRKVDLALELERATHVRATRASPACAPPCTRTASARARSPRAPASASGAARPSATCRSLPSRSTATRPRSVAGSRSAAHLATSPSTRPPTDAVERATRLLGAQKPPTQRVTLVLEPRMTATVLGIVGGMLNGESVLKGRSPFAERVGDAIASPLLTFVDDPTNPESLGADSHDGEGLAYRRNALLDGRRAPGLPAQHLHGAARRHDVDRLGGPRHRLDAGCRRGRRSRSRQATATSTSCSRASTSGCSSSR